MLSLATYLSIDGFSCPKERCINCLPLALTKNEWQGEGVGG